MRIHYGPVTEVTADAIVNAANTQLRHGGGVAAAIVRAGGRVIQEESDRVGWCDLGKAVATTAGKLPARYVIHVPTIDYAHGRRASIDDIYEGTRSALALCRELGLKSVAFPLLGAGIVGVPAREVAQAMARAIAEYPDIESMLCAFSASDRQAVEGLSTSDTGG
ncbi:MAG: macro domain-containing protein [Dehalococcoidia bacterium]|jgi:O-acetyl-ADP-ribose deacetylase (regulator of RNase III)